MAIKYIKKINKNFFYLYLREKFFRISRYRDLERRDTKMMKHARQNRLIPHMEVKHPSIWIKQKGCCFYCDKELYYPRNRSNKIHLKRDDLATIDHHIPKFLGGARTKENLVYACNACNAAKGHELWQK